MMSFASPEMIAGVMLLAMNAYVLTGGADFGGGVWDLLASGPRRSEQRGLIVRSIAPIWEANHVWLILVVVILFTAFPGVYATLGTVLHIPLSLMLAGIVLRGSAFMFRSYAPGGDTTKARWGSVFSIASIVTPVFLGIIVGAIASGGTGLAAAALESSRPPAFPLVFLEPWLSPFPLLVGVMALALFGFLAAVYLAVAAESPELQDDFRARALSSAVAVFAAAVGALAVGHEDAPAMSRDLTFSAWALPFQGVTAITAITAVWALWVRRFTLARVAAAAQVSLILWGWAFSQFPFVLPPSLTLRDAAAPAITLKLLMVALITGALVLFPSLAYLYRKFSTSRPEAASP